MLIFTQVSGPLLTARNKECDYSAAYIVIKTDGELQGQGMTFSKLAYSKIANTTTGLG